MIVTSRVGALAGFAGAFFLLAGGALAADKPASGAKLLTPAQARACLAQKDTLHAREGEVRKDKAAIDAENSTLNAEKASLDSEKSTIGAERAALERETVSLQAAASAVDRASSSAVDEVNARVVARNARSQAFQAKRIAHDDKVTAYENKVTAYENKMTAYNTKAEPLQALRSDYEKTCENRSYDEKTLGKSKTKP